MKAIAKLKDTAKQIVERLKEISQSDWEAEFEMKIVPQPIIEVYAKLRKFKSMQREKDDGNTKAGNTRNSNNE